MQTARTVFITGLLIAVGVLGYLYYDATKNDVSVKLDVPNVEINKN